MNRRPRIVVSAVLAFLFATQNVASAAPRGDVGGPRLGRLGATKRAFKATDKVKLDGGEEVSAQRYADEMNQLQAALETDGVSLKKEDHKPPPKALPLYAGAFEEKARDKAALGQQQRKLADIEAGGFSALKKKRLLGARGGAIGAAPRPGAVKGAGGPSDDDALDVTFNQTLGSNQRASIYIGVVLKDTGETDKVGCDASIDGGVYVFNEKKQLVKMAASGSIKGSTVNGSVDLFLLGQSVQGFPKRGSSPNAGMNKSIAPPAAKMKYGWGPIGIDVSASIAGELRLNASNTQQGPNAAQKGKCTVSAEPTLRASAKASASVSAIAYKVGVEGNIVLIDIKTPMSSSVMVKPNPATMTEDFRANVNAVFLDGDVAFFVKTRIPQDGERFWDLDWDQVYRKMLFDWDGLRIDSKLANFSGKQTSL